MPTGVGKTAIALAAPFLAAEAKRVLVVVPTQELRRQTVERFRAQDVLRRIGALPADDGSSPIVLEVTGRVDDWGTVEDADVVVALPASISPVHYDTPPPQDLFDLIVVDEAHHAPATTWNTILDTSPPARCCSRPHLSVTTASVCRKACLCSLAPSAPGRPLPTSLNPHPGCSRRCHEREQ